MPSIWGPAGMTREEELFNQQVQAPEAAPLAKGFWETITPQIMGAIANVVLPGSGEATKTATNELQGGDPVQTQAPEFNGGALLAAADKRVPSLHRNSRYNEDNIGVFPQNYIDLQNFENFVGPMQPDFYNINSQYYQGGNAYG